MSADSPSLYPHSSTWSCLLSLATPSPPPSWPSLTTLRSSGEIPILLHSGIQVPESFSPSSSSGSSLRYSGDEREDKSLASSHSFETVNTVGTFGPVRFKLRRPTDAGARPYRLKDVNDALQSLCNADGPACSRRPGIPTTPPSPNQVAVKVFELAEDPPLSTTVKRFSVPDLPALVNKRIAPNRQSQRDSPLHSRIRDVGRSPTRVLTLPPPAMEDSGQVLLVTPSHSLSTLPTPVFAPPSPAYSTPESSPNRAFKNRLRYAVNKGISYVAARSSPSSSQSGSPAHAAGSAPPSPVANDGSPKRRKFGRSRTGSTSTTDSVASSSSTPPPMPTIEVLPTAPSVSSLDFVRFASLPISLSWLKTTVVELLIDQEGFRTIQPAFHLVGYTGPPGTEPSKMSLNLHLTQGRADFMPARRQSFAFHHATLDTPPVLRRVTRDGDASRDYTSRQAYLPLKARGPYSVHGAEAADGGALAWQLDYLVGARRTDSGRAVPGERTLTPLCFSCAPGLLHPAHAKKVRLVHVVRKGIVPKLTAERLAPPAPPRAYLASRGLPPARRDEGGEAAMRAAGTHRRVRSHALKRSSPEGNLGAGRGAIPPSTSYQGVLKAYDTPQTSGGPHTPAPDRHILSSAMIAAILSEPSRSGGTVKAASSSDEHPMVPLSPPRRR